MRALFASTQGAGHFNPLVPFIDAACGRGTRCSWPAPPPHADMNQGSFGEAAQRVAREMAGLPPIDSAFAALAVAAV